MVYYNAKAGELLKAQSTGILRSHRGKNLELCKLFTPLSETYQVLCNYAANYCLPTELTTHASLGLEAYAHASSPIRRYADIVNQCALKNILFAKSFTVPYSIDTLNRCMKSAKRYTRDLAFIDLYYSTSILSGTVLNSVQIFIHQLQKVIKYSTDLATGTSISLSYYTDQQQLQWKTRVIFKALI
jgi:exoribonuclease R